MVIPRMLLALTLSITAAQVALGQAPPTAGQEQLKGDQLQIAVQGICPVTGQKLGDHGSPIKVTVGKESVFLCCKGCLQREINPQHWGTIHANFAKAQRICPVMKEELPQNPKWTIVSGRIIYVCCPPCTKKIDANPKEYLKAVDELYAASLKGTPAAK